MKKRRESKMTLGAPRWKNLAAELLQPMDTLDKARRQVRRADFALQKMAEDTGERPLAELEMLVKLGNIQLKILELRHELRGIAIEALDAEKQGEKAHQARAPESAVSSRTVRRDGLH